MKHEEAGSKAATEPVGTLGPAPDEQNHDSKTEGRRHRVVSKTQILLKIALVSSLVFCSNSLYAYANFREVKGEKFLRAINAQPVFLYSRTKNTWGIEAYEDLVLDRGDPYHTYLVSGRYIFWWGSNVRAAMALYEPDVPGVKLVSVTHQRTMTRVGIETFFNPPNEGFRKQTDDALTAVKRRFENEDDIPWAQSVWVQLRWGVPTIAGYWASSRLTTDSQPDIIILEVLLGFVLTVGGYVALPFLVLSPSWLAIPIFWLWIPVTILYVVLPQRAWEWIGDKVKLLRKRIFADKS